MILCALTHLETASYAINAAPPRPSVLPARCLPVSSASQSLIPVSIFSSLHLSQHPLTKANPARTLSSRRYLFFDKFFDLCFVPFTSCAEGHPRHSLYVVILTSFHFTLLSPCHGYRELRTPRADGCVEDTLFLSSEANSVLAGTVRRGNTTSPLR